MSGLDRLQELCGKAVIIARMTVSVVEPGEDSWIGRGLEASGRIFKPRPSVVPGHSGRAVGSAQRHLLCLYARAVYRQRFKEDVAE